MGLQMLCADRLYDSCLNLSVRVYGIPLFCLVAIGSEAMHS
jgi:hypothetical protein